jgi:hypothetical protein
MALPDVTITIQDGALGQVPPSVAGAQFKVGVCSAGLVNTMYTISDIGSAQAALGQGPLVDAISHTLSVAGGPVYAMPVNPSSAGSAGSVTHTGPGTGTLTVSLAPAQSISIKVSTGGALGTAQFQFSLGGGAYSAPVLSGATPWSYAVPGTLTTITITSAGTFVLNDVYTISTLGVITLVGTGPAATVVTQVSSPLDAYSVIVTMLAGGALGTATFNVSVDGGNSLVGGQIATPGGGSYAVPNTGVVLVFSGTFTLADTYAFTTTTAGFSSTDVTNAYTVALASSILWGFSHLVGAASTSAGAATIAATVDTLMTTAQTAYRFTWTIVECPTSEADATVIAAFAAFASARTMVCAGDVGALSPMNGRVLRRNNAWIVSAHISAIAAGEDAGFVGSTSPIKNVVSLYPNGTVTTWNPVALDAARFTTMRTLPGKQGYFITNGNMMAVSGSDFNLVQRRRVMDIACTTVRAALLNYLNASVRVNKTTGYIDERDAQQIEAKVNDALNSAIVATGFATAASVVLNRTTNLLSTNNEPVSVRVTPLAYLKTISVSIGFSNPALAA